MYKPPPNRDPLTSPVDVGIEGARLFWRQDVYRKKVVDFSISIQVWDEETSTWCDVYRVDTSHGELHDHFQGRDGTRQRRVIAPIPDQGWDFVDSAWDDQLAQCIDTCGAKIEKWRRAR